MTKLIEWLTCSAAIFVIWLSLITERWLPHLNRSHPNVVLWSPLIGVALFGVYSVLVIAVRVYNFNDCEDAAKELKLEIQDAKRDLKEKGIIIE